MKNNLKFLRRKSIGMALIGVLTFFTACDKGIDADEVFVPRPFPRMKPWRFV